MLGLTQILCSSRTVQLKHIVNVAGTELNNVDAVANLLGQRSIRHTAHMIELWKSKLTEEDLKLLKGFKDGSITLDWTDPFPRLGLTLDLTHQGLYWIGKRQRIWTLLWWRENFCTNVL